MQLRNGKTIGDTETTTANILLELSLKDIEDNLNTLMKEFLYADCCCDVSTSAQKFLKVFEYIEKSLPSIVSHPNKDHWKNFFTIAIERIDSNIPTIINNKHDIDDVEQIIQDLNRIKSKIKSALALINY